MLKTRTCESEFLYANFYFFILYQNVKGSEKDLCFPLSFCQFEHQVCACKMISLMHLEKK
ncbi:unnamed protein product [Amoebophrya sp. A120]|nr:unnamed protein product [Amoebophrya sp. A120]|eukprot:GSA120T00024272001.1